MVRFCLSLFVAKAWFGAEVGFALINSSVNEAG